MTVIENSNTAEMRRRGIDPETGRRAPWQVRWPVPTAQAVAEQMIRDGTVTGLTMDALGETGRNEVREILIARGYDLRLDPALDVYRLETHFAGHTHLIPMMRQDGDILTTPRLGEGFYDLMRDNVRFDTIEVNADGRAFTHAIRQAADYRRYTRQAHITGVTG